MASGISSNLFEETGKEDLLTYLKQMVSLHRSIPYSNNWPYLCVEDFLLKHGRFYPPVDFLPDGMRKGTPQRCFWNSYSLVKKHSKSLLYVEGMAVGSIIPVHHAWVCRMGMNEALDVTWEKEMQKVYFGVAFSIKVVPQAWSILNHWQKGWPLLSSQIPYNKWSPKC